MYIKSLTIGNEKQELRDKQIIGVFNESYSYRRAIDMLFATRPVAYDGTLLSPDNIVCEAEAYGYTIERAILSNTRHIRRAGVIKDELTFVGETRIPQKIDLPRPVKRIALKDISSFFEDTFSKHMLLLCLNTPSEYISQAEEFWSYACEEKLLGLYKKDLKKILTAIDRFKRDLPEKNPTSVPDELYDYFVSNALHKVACDTFGKESLPLFLTDSFTNLSDEEVQNTVSLARKSGRQVFFLENMPRVCPEGTFDVIL